MLAHIANGSLAGAVVSLIAFAVSDQARFRRFLTLFFVCAALVAAWWLVARGGVYVLLREFAPAVSAGHTASSAKVSTR